VPLPFRDDSFGTVVSNSAIEHRFFSERSLAECLRVLKPGGTFIICLPNTAHWICRLWLLFGRFPYVRNSPLDETHLRFFTVREAKNLCKKHGAVVTGTDGHASLWVREFYPRPFRWRPVAAAYNRLARVYPSLFARDFVLICRKAGDGR
jgi:SAM-dependent methyltransferase